MAQKVVMTMTDDIDGSEANETVRFGLDGRSYEIDLNETHASELREVLAPYMSVARADRDGASRTGRGRSVGGGRGRSGSSGSSGSSSGDVDPKAVRAWAAEQGIEVNARGRIPAQVVRQYQDANG